MQSVGSQRVRYNLATKLQNLTFQNLAYYTAQPSVPNHPHQFLLRSAGKSSFTRKVLQDLNMKTATATHTSCSALRTQAKQHFGCFQPSFPPLILLSYPKSNCLLICQRKRGRTCLGHPRPRALPLSGDSVSSTA